MTTSPVPKTRRARVEEKERVILEAARSVFEERGYEGARMAEIARRAAIAEGTIYLYFETKQALMQAVMGEFWENLTKGARAVIDVNTPTEKQLRALADFHLTSLIATIDFINLTVMLRGAPSGVDLSLNPVRAYVAVFDEIFRRGMDRGDFGRKTPVWIARDVFFGTLEYSARTIVLREAVRPTGVVENLVTMFRSAYGTSGQESFAGSTEAATQLTDRLEAAIEKLESLT